MQTQIQCPQCGSPAVAEMFQLINVDRQPELKRLLLSGGINAARCGKCGWQGQVATPLVYHESDHDLLISFVPMELQMPYAEQERMMGQLVRRVVDEVPNEKRRAYLLQPQQMFRWQTFIERILETEGVTREMIELQRRQMALLQKLSSADSTPAHTLLAESADDIDETFVVMVQSTLQQLSQAEGQDDLLIKFSNVQAWLLRETEAGRRVEKRQMAMHALNHEARTAGQVTPELLLKHVLRNQHDDDVVDGLVAATGALSYEFFSGLSGAIDEAARAGDQPAATRLTAIRTRLLKLYDEMRAATEKAFARARDLVNEVAAAPDRPMALQQAAGRIDEMFLAALEQELAQARRDMNLERSAVLQEIQTLLDEAMQHSPEMLMQFVGALLQNDSEDSMRQMLAENSEMVTDELTGLIDMLVRGDAGAVPPELVTRLEQMHRVVGAFLANR